MVKKARRALKGPVDAGAVVAAPPTRMQMAVRLIRLKERARVLLEMVDLCQEGIRAVDIGVKKVEGELSAMGGKRRPAAKT